MKINFPAPAGVGNGILLGPAVPDPNDMTIEFYFTFADAGKSGDYIPLFNMDDLNVSSESGMRLDIGKTGDARLFWYGQSHETNFIQTEQTPGGTQYLPLNQDGLYKVNIVHNTTSTVLTLTYPNLTTGNLSLSTVGNTWQDCFFTIGGSRSIWWGDTPIGLPYDQDPECIVGPFSGAFTFDTAYTDAGKTIQADIGDKIHTISSDIGDFIADQSLGPYPDVFLSENGVVVSRPSIGSGAVSRANPRDSAELRRIQRELRTKLKI